jgi:hypothetical protein
LRSNLTKGRIRIAPVRSIIKTFGPHVVKSGVYGVMGAGTGATGRTRDRDLPGQVRGFERRVLVW